MLKIGTVLIYLVLLVVLVWGPTIRNAQANQNFRKGNYPQARDEYRGFTGGKNVSPVILHNLGISWYQLGRFAEAHSCLNQACTMYITQVRSRKGSTQKINPIVARFHYHLGNALFQSAAQSGTMSADTEITAENRKKMEQAMADYAAALGEYKKALLANPNDFEAKYNYEITLARLGQSPPPQQQERPPVQSDDQYLKENYEDVPPPNGKDW